jgi:hypothetical protein
MLVQRVVDVGGDRSTGESSRESIWIPMLRTGLRLGELLAHSAKKR